MTLRAELGLSPWDVLADGLRRQTPLTFGTAVIVIGAILVISCWLGGIKPGPGTLANMTLIGVFADLMLNTGWGAHLGDDDVALRVALLVCGIVVIAVGSALYIGAGLGTGPRDSLMMLVARKTKLSIGASRAIVEGSALVIGIVLGGSAGVGTVVFAVTIGPAVQLFFKLFKMDAGEPERLG
jgi:uncharacterized membrane protein YczE